MPLTAAYKAEPRHASLGPAFYDEVEAASFPKALLRFRNDRWARRIGLDGLTDAEWIEHLARFRPLAENLPRPLALRYHGHQFRAYNPDLGDGRGFLYAQMRDAADGRLLDLGTKGSGQTPWSRRGDGRLTLKGGVREVLATEMLEALGVYTSKSLSLVETGEALVREDEPSPTRSSVLVRLSHSHVRIGTFQRFAALGDEAGLRRLTDYAIETYWPAAAEAEDPVAAFLRCVVGAVAEIGAEWFQAGFVHGVLNTDNTVITGESFDYGPWRFLPTLDPRFTAAYFDETGLYAFGAQAGALFWNLQRLAECLLPLSSEAALVQALETFGAAFEPAVVRGTLARLGLADADGKALEEIVRPFYSALAAARIPFEQAFFDLIGGADPERLERSPNRIIYAAEPFATLCARMRGWPRAPGLPEALARPYFSDPAPATMLIGEVEGLWAPIAERDDWQAFSDRIGGVRRMGEAYAPLLLARTSQPGHVRMGA